MMLVDEAADLKLCDNKPATNPKQQILSLLESGKFTKTGIEQLSFEQKKRMYDFFETFKHRKDPAFAQQLYKAVINQVDNIDPAKMMPSSRRALKYLKQFDANKQCTKAEYRELQSLFAHIYKEEFAREVRPVQMGGSFFFFIAVYFFLTDEIYLAWTFFCLGIMVSSDR